MIARVHDRLWRQRGLIWIVAALGSACAASVPHHFAADLTVQTARWTAPSGCRLTYRHYHPLGAARGLALLVPGWLRRAHHLDGLARAVARAGIAAVTVDFFCRDDLAQGSAVRDALDLIALARALGSTAPVYLGFSAGGLRAVLAAAFDAEARGAVVLDLVDQHGLGWRIARTLEKPLLGISGAPSKCNADANGTAVIAFAPRARLLHLPQARHCDFEAPTDGWCTALCPPPPEYDEDHNRRRIVAATVAAVNAVLAGTPENWPPDDQGQR